MFLIVCFLFGCSDEKCETWTCCRKNNIKAAMSVPLIHIFQNPFNYCLKHCFFLPLENWFFDSLHVKGFIIWNQFFDFGSGYHISRRLNPILMYFTLKLAVLNELKIINYHSNGQNTFQNINGQSPVKQTPHSKSKLK